jgi:hypothetical protein
MPVVQGTEALNPLNILDGIPTERLAFIAAILFLIGSSMSFYIAYKNLKTSSSALPATDEATLR